MFEIFNVTAPFFALIACGYGAARFRLCAAAVRLPWSRTASTNSRSLRSICMGLILSFLEIINSFIIA